jgi:hypothetical protein
MPIAVAKHGFWWVNGFSPIQVFPGSLSPDNTSTPDTVTFTATGGSAPTSPYVFSYTGTIPTGTSLDSSGHLTGTPTTPGTYNFTVTATDANGKTGHRDYTQVITTPDRSVSKSKNVLIVWDPNSVLPGRYTSDVVPANLTTNISARETALGFIPHTITSYADLVNTDITNYAHIWDIGYDTLITGGAADKYLAYLQSGGAIFLLGENGYFIQRDNTVTSFVTEAGGGSNSVVDSHYYGHSTIQPEFLLANSDNNVEFYDVANFSSYGTGTPMVVSDSNLIQSVVWKTGSLTNAPVGAIAVILDVNWLDDQIINSIQPNLIDNMSVVLNKK